jgi:hypothetical protein
VAAAIRRAWEQPEALARMAARAAEAAARFDRGALLRRFVELVEETAGARDAVARRAELRGA